MLPNCYSLDIPGTFSKTAEDAAILFTALAKPYPEEDWPAVDALASAGIRGMKIAVVRDPCAGFPLPDEALGSGFECALKVLAGLGDRLVDARLPDRKSVVLGKRVT